MKYHSEDKPFVIIESPYPRDSWINEEYGRDCLYDSIVRGEAPVSIPILYSEVLDPRDLSDQEWCKKAGEAILRRADIMAVYTDRGISMPMRMGIEVAKSLDLEIQYRILINSSTTRSRKSIDF